jgi:hypothetical protein
LADSSYYSFAHRIPCVGELFPAALPNFQPVVALFFCGAVLAGSWRGLIIPCVVWLVTYPLPAILEGNAEYLSPVFFLISAGAFALSYWMGKSLARQNAAFLLLGAVGSSLVFHFVTNTAEWVFSPLYAKSLQGLWQSLWLGPEGSAIPSWVFLRNMAVANVLFTLVFLSARFAIPRFSLSKAALPSR